MSDFVTPVLLAQVLSAVAEAGELIRDARNRPKKITLKGRIDLVTETDVAVEKLLKERLAPILPDADFMAEESAESYEPGDLTWIIDPLDGTTNFAHDLPMVAISVGLWRQGSVELGVVSIPVLDETFYAVRGEGAFLNGDPIRVTATDEPVNALVATGFPYSVAEDVDQITAALSRVLPATRGVRRMGAAAVDLAYTACGRLDAFYEMHLKPWDTAAGWLLVEEAGGMVTRFDGTTPYTPGAEDILVTNGQLHSMLSQLVVGRD
ncbi:inositol monophosphatase family protein [Desulfovibrio ferrophilus]|uniref:Inositol-1-monophosphatase n=1 Tax=Desulfovibrio ferrophilus TaxID=241368 RepID=A0A2Z6AWW6_9BACT|nr:inositol monophosphatase family protein [Desulfovibrio ferrophilus]BBD07646.1 inositol monophosphatase [Desulfovibrio ferrophilus]